MGDCNELQINKRDVEGDHSYFESQLGILLVSVFVMTSAEVERNTITAGILYLLRVNKL